MSMNIEINGESERIATNLLGDVLRARGIEPESRGFAVSVNGALVPRRQWAETTLSAGDKVDIVRAFAGG